MSEPLVVIDADVLGRQRTGDETYVRSLLRELAAPAPGDLRLAAVTRRPNLVPEGIEPVELPAHSQVARMAVSVPRLLRRLRPALAHFVHALPLACPCPAVVTIQDLSFERDPSVMPWRDRLIFKIAVPRAARRAARVLAISELTKRDLVELYGIPEQKVTVTPLAADPAFGPNGPSPNGEPYALFVGALQARKEATTAIEALSLVAKARRGSSSSAPTRAAAPRPRRRRPGSESRSSCAAIFRRTSWPSSTAARPASSSRAATRASACRCWRQWPRARRS